MRILVLTRYGRQGASSRVRFYDYEVWLREAGFGLTFAPLFSDRYVSDLQQGRKNKREALIAYTRRARTLLGAAKYDLIWLEKDALPWLPAVVEKLLLRGSVPYVLDYDDATFHQYDHHSNPLIRKTLTGKHPALIRRAEAVTAGSEYLLNFARRCGAKRAEFVPTVIDLNRYPVPNFREPVAVPTIGWIGQRATSEFLEPHKDLFGRLSAEGAAKFAAIGIDAPALGLPMMPLPWSADTEVASINTFDVGIMPVADGVFERGKCGYKLIQYMACGLPVVASPVGANQQIVQHGVNGFLADTPQEWEQYLRALISDPDLRHRMGVAGRRLVESTYSIQVTGPKLVSLISSTLAGYRASTADMPRAAGRAT